MAKTGSQAQNASVYAEVKEVLEAGDEDARARLAACPDTAPEVLYYLAGDEAAAVRCAIAANPANPAQADLSLTRDKDLGVRLRLAEKMAGQLAQLSLEEDQSRLLSQILGALARDEAEAVRQVIAEAAKELDSLPHDLVYRLAEDDAESVACPMLSQSPGLRDDDLSRLAEDWSSGLDGGGRQRLVALAKRRTLSAAMSERLVASGDDGVIAVLLENAGAEIADGTLEALAERAESKPAWHEPLVGRPRLTPRTVFSLVRFVAKSLLRRLRARNDLDPHTLAVVEQELESRLGGGRAPRLGGRGPASECADKAEEEAMARAVELLSQDRLDSEELSEALMEGDDRLVSAGLALLAGYNLAFVKHVRNATSAKGVVALAWKAGLSPRFAGQLQATWAHIPRQQVLPTTDAFPLSKEEMRWQLEFLEGLRE